MVEEKSARYDDVFKKVVEAVKENPLMANRVKDVLRDYFPDRQGMVTVGPHMKDNDNYNAICVGLYDPKDNATVVVEWEGKRVGPNPYDASKNRESKGFEFRMVVREGNLVGINPLTNKPRDIRTVLEPADRPKVVFDRSKSELK